MGISNRLGFAFKKCCFNKEYKAVAITAKLWVHGFDVRKVCSFSLKKDIQSISSWQNNQDNKSAHRWRCWRVRDKAMEKDSALIPQT